MGGPGFSMDSDGSLLISSPSGDETGEFVCTATNAAGSASKKVQLTVYGNLPFIKELSRSDKIKD